MKLSCVITLYNDENYIERCISSILAQTYQNFEIVVVNDGSTDNSLSICENINDSRIRIISQENKGVCAARNRGIKESQGDYCLFIDSDDFYNNDKMFEILIRTINKYKEPELITFDYVRVYSNGTIYDEFKNDGEEKIYNNYDACKEYLSNNNLFSMVLWRRCYKKEIFKKIYFEDKILPEDLFTSFDIYSSSSNIVHLSKSFYSYFIKDNGLTIQDNQKDYINLLYISESLYDKEIKFFKNDDYMKTKVKSIYYNYLLTIYAKFYYSENNNIKQENLKTIKNKIKFNEIKNVEAKTKVALFVFFISKRLFSKYMNIRSNKRVKER